MNDSHAALSGMIFIDKPRDWTSTTVVRKIKKTLQIRRVGHLGTLDPFATGLLPIMIGNTTRLADEFMKFDKQYLFTIQLGIQTDTLDSSGLTLKTALVPPLKQSQILKVFSEFTGNITQVPPAYSAIKMNGRPLYEYMRTTGHLPSDIQTKARNILIKNLELIHFTRDTITARVLCSKGTYIRSLARDIAITLNSVGMCSELRREKIGPWCVTNAVQIKTDTQDQIFCDAIIAPQKLLPHTSYVSLNENYGKKLSSGNVFFVEKSEEHFSQLESSIGKKIFVDVTHSAAPLFLAAVERHSGANLLKIKPLKKITN